MDRNGCTAVVIQYGHRERTKRFKAVNVEASKLNLVHINGKLEIIDPFIRNNVKGAKPLISAIRELKSTIEGIALSLHAKNLEPTVDLVGKQYDEQRVVNTGKADPRSIDFDTLYQSYLVKSDGVRWSNNTIKQYKSTYSALKRFSEYSGEQLRLDSFDLNFYDKFVAFLRAVEKKKDNTIGNLIKNLKSFLSWAQSRGHVVHQDFLHRDFKKIKKLVEVVYLNQEELNSLISLDLTNNERLANVRDVFVFNCRTGLRYGDLKRLNKAHITEIVGQEVIQLIQQKTDRANYIPLSTVPKEILQRYNYKLPLISEQKQNKYLKELCALAGINSAIETSEGIVPKYERITTHVAIKTFITHCCELGIDEKSIAEMTGKSVRVIMDHYHGVNKSYIVSKVINAFNEDAN